MKPRQRVLEAAARLLQQRREKHNKEFRKLFVAMERETRLSSGYRYGGGHGVPLDELAWGAAQDCSGSVSKVLNYAGFFPHRYAWDSTEFMNYGAPGRGKYFTIYASPEHVWIRLHKTPWWRFDTSPWGWGRNGPRLRMAPRWTKGFTARHWPGM